MNSSISTFIVCTTFFTLIFLSSCSSISDPSNDIFCDDLQEVSQTYIDAAILHDQDPSVENCKSYKAATEAYLDIIKECSLSSAVQLEDAQETLDALDC